MNMLHGTFIWENRYHVEDLSTTLAGARKRITEIEKITGNKYVERTLKNGSTYFVLALPKAD